jgi:hypothetical protein
VPSNATTDPACPFKVNNSTAADDNSTRPSTVNTVVAGNSAPPATVNVAPPATVTSVEDNRPDPLKSNVPAFTKVEPVYVLTPLSVNTPEPAFTNEPADVPFAITPPNVPSPTVNAVPFKATAPVTPPFKADNVTAAGDNINDPSKLITVPVDNAASVPTVNDAPDATDSPVEVSLPVPLNANVPAFTEVVPE